MKSIDGDKALAALEESMDSIHRPYSLVSGSTAHDEGDCYWYESAIGNGIYGGVFRQRFSEETADRRIQEVEEAMPLGYGWMVLPTATPPDLGERIARAGGKQVIELKGMALHLDDLAPAPKMPLGVELIPADSEDLVRDYALLYPLLFGLPAGPWLEKVAEAELEIFRSGHDQLHRYLALENRKPIAAGATVTHGGSASLGTLFTLPEARNRGIGQALATHGLQAERSAGADLAVLWAGPGADPLYERMGFRYIASALGYVFHVD